MMQVLGEKSKGIIAWIIISMIIIAFAFFGASNYFLKTSNNLAVKVNGTEVTWDEVDRVSKRYTQSQDISPKQKNLLKLAMRENLAKRAALTNGSYKLGYYVSDNVLEDMLISIPAFQVNGKFSKDAYYRIIYNMGISDYGFRQTLKTDNLLKQAQEGMLLTEFVFDENLDKYLKLLNQSRNIGYTVISPIMFKNQIQVTDEEISTYYEKNKSTFMDDEKVSIKYVTLGINNIAKDVKVTDEEINDYYNQHLAEFTSPHLVNISHILIESREDVGSNSDNLAKVKIDKIKADLKNGKSFEEIAKQESDDKSSKASGGKLNWMGKGDTPSIEFENAAFALTKKGEYSDIIRTKYGYHIIKLNDIKNPITKPLKDVKPELLKTLKREKSEHKFSTMLEEMQNLAFENSGSLERIASDLNLEIKESELFSRIDTPTKILTKDVIHMAFSEEVLVNGLNSDTIKISEDTYIVLRNKDHIPKRQQELKEVSGEIKNILTLNKSKEKTIALGKEILEKVKNGEGIQPIVSSNKLAWSVVANVKRIANKDENVPQHIKDYAFKLKRPKDGQDSIDGFIAPDGSYILVEVVKVKDGDLNKITKEQKEQIKDALRNEMAAQVNIMYQNSIIDNTKITYFD